MPVDRRSFLVGSALALCRPWSTVAAAGEPAGTAGEDAEFVSACRMPDGSYAIVLIGREGRILRQIPLSARGHDIAVDRIHKRAVAFSRRPGYFAVAFDIAGHREPQVFAPEPGRHFFGHGSFSADGRLLFTTEQEIESGQGLIGIYDATGGMKRVGEFPSHGIGPHEVVLLPDGRTLAVANGGIQTDPATGREEIGLSAMVPSLVFLDSNSGDVRASHGLPPEINKLSIRHLAATPAGDVWFGGQWQGSLLESPELLGRANIDGPIRIVEPREKSGTSLKGYIGSVAMSASGRILAASAPRAGRIVYLDTGTGAIVASTALEDGCGIASVANESFALSSGHGAFEITGPDAPPSTIVKVPGAEFDNHLRRLI